VEGRIQILSIKKMDHQIGCWDSVLLENESENCFISNLNLRFKRDIIYVSFYFYFYYSLFSVLLWCGVSENE
jgi:hypothetical protein